MGSKMLIDASHPEETRVVVLKGNRIEEFDFESASRRQLKGNIYLAKVTRVEPSLQAAFIEYGGNRHGFLAFSEIHPDYYQIPLADRQALLQAEEEEHARENEEDDEDEGNGQRRQRRGRDRDRGQRAGVPPRRPAPTTATAMAARKPTRFRRRSRTARPARPTSRTTTSEEHEEPKATADDMTLTTTATRTRRPRTRARRAPSPWPSPMTTRRFPSPWRRRRDGEPEDHAEAVAEEREAQLEAEAIAPAPTTERGMPGELGNGVEEVGEDPETARVESIGAEDALEEVPQRRRKVQRRQYKIQEVIKRRQVILVQVVKEERGNKGAALTTYLSLAGRYCVLMPNTARGGGISRKITDFGRPPPPQGSGEGNRGAAGHGPDRAHRRRPAHQDRDQARL